MTNYLVNDIPLTYLLNCRNEEIIGAIVYILSAYFYYRLFFNHII